MTTIHQQVEDFFRRYEALFEQALGDNPVVDVDGIVNNFADYFVESSPVGVQGGANDETFREAIPKGYAFYKHIGTTSMRVAALDVTELDPLHVMAKVHWVADYRKPDGTDDRIEFDNIYFLTFASGSPKVFAYITPDEQAALREHGLISGEGQG